MTVIAMAVITYRRTASTRIATTVWPRLSFAALLAATFVLYVWGLDRSGWANAYYAAAVHAGTKSWKAFFFGDHGRQHDRYDLTKPAS